MAQSKYASSRETTNLARVARIICGPGTDVLRSVLKKEVKPIELIKKLKTFLCKHPMQNKINQHQINLVNGGNYDAFDITLLYFLLRNMCSFPPHINQWGNDPKPGDRSESANIERMRLIRNEFGHNSEIIIKDTDFNKKWQELFDIVKELETYAGTSTDYQDAVVKIKSCTMDPEEEAKYIEKLLDLTKEILAISDEIREMKSNCVPKNVKDVYERDISKWIEEDNVFLETHNFPAMLHQVRNQPYVTFVGVPGSGKTATVRHIALILQKEGYEILPIVDKNKLEDYCDSQNPQVFVIDDVLGLYALEKAELKTLERYKDRLIKPTFSKTKVLMTCRICIYRNEQVFKSDLFRKENILSLQSAENALNEKDKYDLLAIYGIDKTPFTYDNLTLTSKMFPFLCNFYSKESKIKSYGHYFFKSPVPCILKLLDKLETENRIQYAALVLLMANENKLSEEILDNEMLNDKKRNFLKKCRVSQHTDNFQIVDALSEMQETYIDRHGNIFTFIHSYLFEIIAYHFGRRFPELILQYMSSYYIACNIKIDTNNSKKRKRKKENEDDNVDKQTKFDEEDNAFNLRIHLKEESHFQHFADRLVKDVEKGDFYVVFGNKALEEQPVRFAFIKTLKKKPFKDLRSIFLSDFNNASNITDFMYEQSRGHMSDTNYIRCLMTYYRFLLYPESYNARAVNWVIGYGHYFILDFIIDQIIKENGTVDELFQTTFNESHLHSSVIMEQNDTFLVEESAEQNDTDLEEDISQDGGLIRESDVESDNSVDVQMKESNIGNDIDSESFVEINNDPVIQEQCCLIRLGCYSGNLNIVLLLLKYVKKDALNISVNPRERLSRQHNAYVIENELKNLNIDTKLLKERTIVNIKAGYETPLTIASENGNLSIVRELLKNGANVNCTAGKDRPLTAACRQGHLNIVSELLKAEAIANDDTGIETPLTAACEEGHLNIVLELLKAGADVNFGFDNPLVAACESGHLCIVQALIQKGAEIKSDSYNPLSAACQNGHLKVVLELLKAGADVNNDKSKNTPLARACYSGHLDIVDELIKAGADLNLNCDYLTALEAACDHGHLVVLKLLMKTMVVDLSVEGENTGPGRISYFRGHLGVIKKLIEIEDNSDKKEDDESSLLAVCDRGHLSKVVEMLRNGAEVNLRDGVKTPLIVACYKGHLDVVKELIQAGAFVNLGNECITPLQVACYEGHLNIISTLITNGVDVNTRDGNDTGLTGACFFGHLSIVKELINANADINQIYGEETPLTLTSYMGHLGIVKELVKAGANVNLKDKTRTPLTAACDRGHWEVVHYLIKHGADTNLSDGNKTPLTAACLSWRWNILSKLFSSGADVNLSDGNVTPLTAACWNEDLDVLMILIKFKADVNLSDGYNTPLTVACYKGNVDVLWMLIKAGANVNQTVGNKTPLNVACDREHKTVAEMLRKAGAV